MKNSEEWSLVFVTVTREPNRYLKPDELLTREFNINSIS